MNLNRLSQMMIGFGAISDKLKAYVLAVFQARYNEVTIETRPDPKVLEILDGRVELLIEKHRDMLLPDLKFQLMEGYKNGESIDKISERVKEVFSGEDYQIERVVRTEILNASNAGAYEANKDKGAKFKRWKAAMGNARTAEDSKRLNDQLQPIDEPFVDPETGDTCQHPPNRPNCRCSVDYYIEDPDVDN